MNYITFNINLEKYTLLKKVDPDLRNTIIDEIIENGYNNYVRGFIRENNIVSNIVNHNITESKFSVNKGQIGENVVYEILLDKFSDYIIENMSKIPHSGDIQITLPKNKENISLVNKIIVEVKNYNKTVDQSEIDKLKFDMKFNKINYSLLLSLNSGIVGKKRFQFESFYHDNEYYYILYIPYGMHKLVPTKKNIIIHNSLEESISNLSIKLEFSICIMSNLITSLIKRDQGLISYNDLDKNVDVLISELNKIYEEFILIKQSSIKMEDTIKKSLEINSQNIKEFEIGIKNRINQLVNIKINNNSSNENNKNNNYNKKSNYKISQFENNNWNIFINNMLIGKIILYDNIYDLLIMINEKYHNVQYDSYEKIINNINFIINNTN